MWLRQKPTSDVGTKARAAETPASAAPRLGFLRPSLWFILSSATGTPRFVARGLLISRPCLWAAAVERNPSWAVKGGRPVVSVAKTASPTERFGSSTSPTPTATKDGGAWKGGGRACVGRRPIRNLLVGWFASLAALVAAPSAFCEVSSGTPEEFLVKGSSQGRHYPVQRI